MSSQRSVNHDEVALRTIHQTILNGWNSRDPEAMVADFADDGQSIGFDGSQHTGRTLMVSDMKAIFAKHQTPSYVGKVRGVRFIGADAAVLTAVVGMKKPGQSEIMPELNAIQTIVAEKRNGKWFVVLFQNTPAQYHGRPELVEKLTAELSELAKADTTK